MPNNFISVDTRRAGPVDLLLVMIEEDEAIRVQKRLEEDHEEVSTSMVTSFGEAVRELQNRHFDAVIVEHDLPDGTSYDLLGRIDILSPHLPVLVLLDRGSEDVAVGIMKAGAADYVRRMPGRPYETEVSFKLKEALNRYHLLGQVQKMVQHREQLRFIETVRSTVANVKHEINNPLSIIFGNAQLLQELAAMDELGVDYTQPLQDVEEASRRISASLDKLEDLKDIIARRYLNEESQETRPNDGTRE